MKIFKRIHDWLQTEATPNFILAMFVLTAISAFCIAKFGLSI